MISGAKMRGERLLVVALLVMFAAPASAFDVDELMATLAHRGAGHASFAEQHFAPGIAQPVVSTGRLDYEPPDRFTRHVLTPHAETTTIVGNRLTITRDGHSHVVLLDSVPEAMLAIEAVRATLTGDVASLKQDFKPTVAGTAAEWQLTLVPRDPHPGGELAEVRVLGRRDVLTGIATRFEDGTRNEMTLTADPASDRASEPASAAAR